MRQLGNTVISAGKTWRFLADGVSSVAHRVTLGSPLIRVYHYGPKDKKGPAPKCGAKDQCHP